jgi:hypothetical protein
MMTDPLGGATKASRKPLEFQIDHARFRHHCKGLLKDWLSRPKYFLQVCAPTCKELTTGAANRMIKATTRSGQTICDEVAAGVCQ